MGTGIQAYPGCPANTRPDIYGQLHIIPHRPAYVAVHDKRGHRAQGRSRVCIS